MCSPYINTIVTRHDAILFMFETKLPVIRNNLQELRLNLVDSQKRKLVSGDDAMLSKTNKSAKSKSRPSIRL